MLLLVTTSAAAGTNSAAAEALFDDGRRLFDAEDYESACPKFAESQRLEAATGTLLNLAHCYEKLGRLATAWSTWREAAASAAREDQAEREAHARAKAEELKPMLARLSLIVSESGRPDDLSIRQNGAEQSEGVWGTSLPVDAGTYRIEASAPGYLAWSSEITIADGELKSVDVPALQVDPNAVEATPHPPLVPAPKQEPSSSMNDSGASSGRSAMKTWGIVFTAAGAGAIAAGTYFGINAIVKNNQSFDNCRPESPNECNETGAGLRDDARTSGTVSSVLVGVGLAAATSGIVMIILAPSENTQIAAAPTSGGAGLLLQGKF